MKQRLLGLPRDEGEREVCATGGLTSRRSPSLLSLLSCLVVSLLALPASAQPPAKPPQPVPPNDAQTQMFRGLFHFRKITPETAANTQRRDYDYKNLIVVVHGNPVGRDDVAGICKATLAAGGAVLISSDTPLDLKGYFPQNVRGVVSGAAVKCFRRENSDAGDPARPLAAPTAAAAGTPFANLRRLATDSPSYLRFFTPPPGMELVAEFADGSQTPSAFGDGWVWVPDFAALAYATTDTDARRCMVLADPDVFSNKLLFLSGRQDDSQRADNFKFADATVTWLQAGWRTKCLFIENGEDMKRFDEFEYTTIQMPSPELPPGMPDLDPLKEENQRLLANLANRGIADVQQRNLLNDAFTGSPERKAATYAVLATLLAFIAYGLIRRRAVFGWFRRLFRPLPKDPAMLGPDVAVGSIGHRRLEVLRSSDFGPVVRQFTLQLFTARGLTGEPSGDKLPPVEIDVRNPKFLRDALRTLWAELGSVAPVGYARWRQLEPMLAAVRAAADDDKWRFVTPSRDAA